MDLSRPTDARALQKAHAQAGDDMQPLEGMASTSHTAPPWTTSSTGGERGERRLIGSRATALSDTSFWSTPPPSRRLMRTPSQDNLITKLRYQEVLDWIGALPLPHIRKLKGRIRPELLQDGNLLWDIALHVLRPDLPNNRVEIERVEDVIKGTDAATDPEKKCRALRDLGICYHRMGLYGSAVEMHAAQLHFASIRVTSGHMDLMQQAIGDLGDVFRTLGENEIAQNKCKASIPVASSRSHDNPAPRQKGPLRVDTPGDLQPWPNTPDLQQQLKPPTQHSASVQSKPKTAKKTNSLKDRPKTLYQRYTFDEEPNDLERLVGVVPDEHTDQFANIMEEMDERSLMSARRVTDVLNLIREACGVPVAEVWPHRHLTEIKLALASRSRPASKALLSSHPAATTAATSDAIQPSVLEGSDGSEYVDDFLERPGTGVLGDFENNNGVHGSAVVSGHEAMWIAWCLCWYSKNCEDPPPDKNSIRQRQRFTPSPESLAGFKPSTPQAAQRVGWDEAGIEPTVDFEARFGHLRQPDVITSESRGTVIKGRAKWHDSALAFVRAPSTKNAKTIQLNGIREPLHGSPNRDSISGLPHPGARNSDDHAEASRDIECMPFDTRGLGALPRHIDGVLSRHIDVRTPSSLARSTRSSSRPKSRQLPAKQWDSHEGDEWPRSRNPEPSKSPVPSPAAHAEAARPFSESAFFTTALGDDGLLERVTMSDCFSWQKLDAVTVSSMSSCGKYGIVTLVAGSKVGVFTMSPFRRIAEIRDKDSSFTCAHASVEMSFVRSVSGDIAASSTELRVDVPDAKKVPNESNNFIAAGESNGRVIIANARSGVTRHTLVQHSEALGSVILLKLVGQGTSGFLYCAHKYGTLTLWNIEKTPSIIWRTQACGTGRSLSGALLLRSCVVTRDDDETCLRIWRMKVHRHNSRNGMLPHDVLHQHTRIAAFTGIQESRSEGRSDCMIASGGFDGTVQVWGSQRTLDPDAPILLFGHQKAITCLFAQSHTRICSGSSDRTCRVWNPAAAKCILILSEHDTPITIVWCDDQQIITVESNGRLRVWSNTGNCICTLEGEVNHDSLASPPKEMLVFLNPLIFTVLDLTGGVTIWCRDGDDPKASTVHPTGLSPFGDKGRTATVVPPKTGAPSVPATVPGTGANERSKTTPSASQTAASRLSLPDSSGASASSERMVKTRTRTRQLALKLISDTGADPFEDDSSNLKHGEPEAQFALRFPRRRWWGSREDRVSQLWPTGRPWESIVKETKHRPAGVRSQAGTPSSTNSSRRQRRSQSVETPDLGRMTSPLPFSPPHILPVLTGTTVPKVVGSQNYPIWMSRGMFMPEVAPSHYPGSPRRSGSPEVSLDMSHRALVEESIRELEGQIRLLKEGSGDHKFANQQLQFFQNELGHVRSNARVQGWQEMQA